MFLSVSLIYFIGIFFSHLTAGIDTTKTIMDWFVCFMSGHPEVQAKCREEIGNIGGF